MKTAIRTETIVLESRIDITYYDGIVFIEYIGKGWGNRDQDYIMMTTKKFNKLTNHGRKLKKNPSILISHNISQKDRIERYSAQYMAEYYKGDWSGRAVLKHILGPKRYLQRGDLTNFFMGYAVEDGFLRHLNDTIVNRTLKLQFYDYSYDLRALQQTLDGRKRFSNIEIIVNTWDGDNILCVDYLPRQGEIDKMLETHRFEEEAVQDLAYIKKYRKTI